MCSTPKGRSSHSIRHAEIQCLTEEMSADDYTALVQHANQSYEQRQRELKHLRAKGKLPPSKLRKAPVKHEDSMLKCLLNFDFAGIFSRLSVLDKTTSTNHLK